MSQVHFFHDHDRILTPHSSEGAGNSFLGGFAAGLRLSGGDFYEGRLYGWLPRISENALTIHSNSTRKYFRLLCN